MWTVRTILAVIAIVVLSAVSPSAQDTELREMAASLASQIKAKGKGPVAITAFAGADYGPAFSIFLVDRLNVLLSRGNNDFDVVARDRVEEAFKEMNLALARNFDSATFARIGKQLGARSLIRGSYTVQAGAAVVSIVTQIVDVETGRIIGGEVTEVRYTGDIKAMLPPRDVGATGSSVSNGADTKSVSVGASKGEGSPSGSGTSPGQQSPQSTSIGIATFQNESIRATIGQAAASLRTHSAVLNIVIENVSRDPVSLAVEYGNAALSDDRGTTFQLGSLTGLPRLTGLQLRNEDEYTVIAPSQRINLIVTFASSDVSGAPATWTFSAGAFYYTASGPKKVSIGLTGIKPTVVR